MEKQATQATVSTPNPTPYTPDRRLPLDRRALKNMPHEHR